MGPLDATGATSAHRLRRTLAMATAEARRVGDGATLTASRGDRDGPSARLPTLPRHSSESSSERASDGEVDTSESESEPG